MANPQFSAKLLVVDDDPDMRALLGRWLEGAGFEAHCVSSGSEALQQLDLSRPDLVITDLVMDEMDGLRLLREVHRIDPVLPVIMLSGQAEIADAVRATHLGVSAFLTKPIEREALVARVVEIVEQNGSMREPDGDGFALEIVHRSPVMRRLLERARLVARAESTVLITGSTGTGKELLARAIHEGGRRKAAPFISINCSAIPDQLLESELFGHEKGAFTGAMQRHEGLFQAASGGTLFLDEIGDMPLGLQAKLLRVLQDFQVRPVGSTRSMPVDVRVISATHQDLESTIADGEFREDLFYRLSVVPLHLPSLDERREDIAPIVDHLVERLTVRNALAHRYFAPEARELMCAAAWPGNIRQLANVVEQCMVLSTSEVIPAELVISALREQPKEMVPLDEAKRQFERRYLMDLLRVTGGQVSKAAKVAGRNRTDFYKLLSRHQLDAAEFRDSALGDGA